MIKPTFWSLNCLRDISDKIEGGTFHHHSHILLDIANTFPTNQKITYMEIGAYAGGSACLMMQRPKTDIISIDLGWPIQPEIVQKNVQQFNKHNNNYTYIKGNSASGEITEQVKHLELDMLFIDGDHSYFGVWNDFLVYSNFVKPNGYIIFDDYNDFENSPLVKSAVDHICNQVSYDYEIIGTFKNTFDAKGLENTNKLGNCFVIKKLDKPSGFNIPLAINIATYRKDDKTIGLLEKTLDSVFNQTYQTFKVFLIGDDYSRPDEIHTLLKKYPSDKIYFENLSFSRERKYHTDRNTIWKYGGTNALNYAIQVSLDEGYDYIAHLDHDDLWQDDHLQEIVKAIEITGAEFICTRARHRNILEMPLILATHEKYVKYLPIYNTIVHSSVCINFSKMPLRYRDLYLDFGLNDSQSLTADSDLWDRCRQHIIKNNLRSFCVNKVTVLHDMENK